MSHYIGRCYGDQGKRLTQLFQIAFGCQQDQAYMADSILLIGDTGIGKTRCLEILAQEYNLQVCRTTLGELAADYDGRLALGLERMVWKATHGDRNIVILEDLDLFFPRYADAQDSGLLPVLEGFLHHIQRVRCHTLLIGTSRKSECIEANAKRLFQDVIKLDIPTPNERAAIMEYLTMNSRLIKKELLNISLLSSQAHAFVASNLAQWCRLAEEIAIQEECSEVTMRHFEQAFPQVHVLVRQGRMAEKPDPVKWSDIGGLQCAKNSLEESAVWIYKYTEAYRRLGIRPSKGVLLYGPPGTGKTLLAKAVATESSANFLPVSVPDLIKAEVGESEKALVSIFQTAIRCSPSVIFLDELEAIFSSRETSGDLGRKLISQFLIEMDHLDKIDQHVILLGATNHLESIDPSILCPGRLDRLIYIGPPTVEERLKILQVLERQTRLGSTVNLQRVAEKSDGYTGADLKALIRKAGLLTLKRQQNQPPSSSIFIEQEDIDHAFLHVSPSLP